MTKAELLARVAELEAENATYAAELGVARVTKIKSARAFKYMTTLVNDGNGVHPHTPGSIDLIRKYVWANKDKREPADIISALISRGFTPSTVRTRVSWIMNGRDESCYNPVIRERLGLDG
jgi:hypothetical protein